MGIILGFGITEQREQQAIKDAIFDGAKKGIAIDEVLKHWHDKAAEYKTLPRGKAPERYSDVYYYDETPHFLHVNREHPFSPDG